MNFYTLEWINEVFKRYQEEKSAFFIEDKKVGFQPKYFLWALLHIYSKKELPFLSESLDIKDLEFVLQHQGFDFMYLVDLLRKEFAYWFRESIICRDFSEESYFTLAQEFLLLEEQLRKQIQIPLLDQMKKLILDLEEIVEENKSLENFDKTKFFRLIKFFNTVEKLEKTKCSELVDRAKNITEKAYKSLKEFEFPLPPISQLEFKKALKEKFDKWTKSKRNFS
ncbi:MAG: hypothetical protein C0190_05730 [Thermodesulfobacterium geofontis]|uniref:Uncharacterized protein n=1 Tax=Thermodesulfobacterium geofontis TaxID=1295609 RepID=A0A2N7PMJ8_9BACT|nr:MAG: hypothetical protein C0190_05730 [Thermodesulfobacterium geofontis]